MCVGEFQNTNTEVCVRATTDDLCIFPAYSAVLEVTPHTWISRMNLAIIPYMRPCARHQLICTAIGHRLYQYSPDSNHPDAVALWALFLRHRGEAIEALSKDMANSDPASQVASAINIALFLAGDVSPQVPAFL